MGNEGNQSNVSGSLNPHSRARWCFGANTRAAARLDLARYETNRELLDACIDNYICSHKSADAAPGTTVHGVGARLPPGLGPPGPPPGPASSRGPRAPVLRTCFGRHTIRFLIVLQLDNLPGQKGRSSALSYGVRCTVAAAVPNPPPPEPLISFSRGGPHLHLVE